MGAVRPDGKEDRAWLEVPTEPKRRSSNLETAMGENAMNTELKDKLTKIAEVTLRDLKVGGVKVTLEAMVRKTQLPVAKNARILAPQDVRRRLMNARLWQPATESICIEWITELLIGILRKQKLAASKVELSAARAKQLELFPGYETLPTRIRTGRNFIVFSNLPVPQFLNYAAKYEKRAQRNQQTAEELRRLATTVEPFAESALTVSAAFERAQMQPAALQLIKPKIA